MPNLHSQINSQNHSIFLILTHQMSILMTPHASNLRISCEIVFAEKLLDRFCASSQEGASPRVPSLAILAVVSLSRVAFADDVAVLIALVADRPLWAFVKHVALIQAVRALDMPWTGIVMMAYLFASKASHITFVVSILIFFHLLLLFKFLCFLHPLVLLLEPQCCLLHLHDFLLQIGGLRLAGELGACDLVGMDGRGERSTCEEIIAVDGEDT